LSVIYKGEEVNGINFYTEIESQQGVL